MLAPAKEVQEQSPSLMCLRRDSGWAIARLSFLLQKDFEKLILERNNGD
jgi:hypothetical protein